MNDHIRIDHNRIVIDGRQWLRCGPVDRVR